MPVKFAANLSFLYQDLPFLDRFSAAAQDGFTGVEYLSPYEFPSSEIRRRLDDNGLTQVLFNLSAGDAAKGERGLASLPGREADFADSLERALEYAADLDCKRLHVMAGIRDKSIDRDRQYAVYRGNLEIAARAAQDAGITALIEPINDKDMPGYFLENCRMAATLIAEINNPHLQLQFDIYHVQRTDGDIINQYLKFAPIIRHIQIANPPHRFEPDNGEINYPYIFDFLDGEGYDGWIGCEYKPSAGTRETLGWARAFLSAKS